MKKIQLPTIIGYIVTGTFIAYGFDLHNAVHNESLKEIAEFGVVFLMFTIGLEFSREHLMRMKNEVFVTGSLQILLSTMFAYLLAHYVFDIESKVAFVIAIAIALSSTAIVLKTFNESGEINQRHGRRALGILIMQDIAVIPILLIIGFMGSHQNQSIMLIVVEMLGSATILLTLLWLIGKYMLEPFFAQVIKTNSDELFVGTILFLAIGASYLAHVLGFSYSLGAFIAGMLIAETKYKYQAEADLVPFRDLLLGVFFITVGMQIDFTVINNYLHIIVMLLLTVMMMKFLIVYALVRMNEKRRVSLKTALSLVQIGEFSLALLELARTNGLIGPPHGQVMIVTIVLSMILTPVILKNITWISDRLSGKEDAAPDAELIDETLQGHVVILGFGEFGHNVANTLKTQGELYMAIENDIDTYHRAQKLGYIVLFGNAVKKEVLKSAAVAKAKKVVIAIDNPKKLYHVCQSVLKMTDESRVIVKVHSSEERNLIAQLGIGHIIVENETISDLVTKTLFDVSPSAS